MCGSGSLRGGDGRSRGSSGVSVKALGELGSSPNFNVTVDFDFSALTWRCNLKNNVLLVLFFDL